MTIIFEMDNGKIYSTSMNVDCVEEDKMLEFLIGNTEFLTSAEYLPIDNTTFINCSKIQSIKYVK